MILASFADLCVWPVLMRLSRLPVAYARRVVNPNSRYLIGGVLAGRLEIIALYWQAVLAFLPAFTVVVTVISVY